MLFLGRHVGYPVALEGALKLKELAYMHAEGFPAGELKHGPIALIEEGLPVVVVMPSPTRTARAAPEDAVSNIAEIKARGARTIVIAERATPRPRAHADHLSRCRRCPTLLSPFVTTVPLQVLAAEIAHGPRQRHRQAAQPGQVRHRRVGRCDAVVPRPGRVVA